MWKKVHEFLTLFLFLAMLGSWAYAGFRLSQSLEVLTEWVQDLETQESLKLDKMLQELPEDAIQGNELILKGAKRFHKQDTTSK